MMESVFWIKYCWVEYLYRINNCVVVLVEVVEDEDLVDFIRDDDIIVKSVKYKI